MKYDIYLAGEVGWSITEYSLREKLQAFEGRECHIFLSSLGGSLHEGVKIYNLIKAHGNVVVHIFGFTASAATIIAMAAKKVVMSQFALFLVHGCSTYHSDYGYYNVEEIESKITELMKKKEDAQIFDELMANIYAHKSSKEVAEMAELMKDAKWLTASQVLDLGLIDEIDAEEGDSHDTQMSTALEAQFVAKGFPLPTSIIPKEGVEQPQASSTENDGGASSAPSPSEPSPNLLQRIASVLGLSMPKEEVGNDGGENPEMLELRSELQQKEAIIAQFEEKVTKLQEKIDSLNSEDGDSSNCVEPEAPARAQAVQQARATYDSIKEMFKN